MTDNPKRNCFVISPIGADDSPERAAADKVLKHLIRKALGNTYDVKRGDSDPNPGAITPAIVASILEADLVIADLSGFNPNVFYEVAIAHGYAKPTVHIQQASERAAFDVKDMRIIRYNLADPDDLENAQKRLRESADFAAANPAKLETPLSSASRFAQVTESVDPVAESNVRVVEALNALDADVRRALRGGTATRDSGSVGEDIRSFRRIIRSVIKHGGLEAKDMNEVITRETTMDFDEWARGALAEVMNADPGDPDLNSILMDSELIWSSENTSDPDPA